MLALPEISAVYRSQSRPWIGLAKPSFLLRQRYEVYHTNEKLVLMVRSADTQTSSSKAYAMQRRKMLDVVNALHLTGVQVDIDLPVIGVVGSQSAGKSSLIEAISGVTLPRASGTCTRCPTECRLSYSKAPWQCAVSLHIFSDTDGRPLGHPRNELFGDTIFSKDDVEERVRQAQCAILNPSIDYHDFLKGNVTESVTHKRELSFSRNSVCLQISGPDVEDLSFCDLPGLIASVGSTGDTRDIELVKELVASYLRRPSCIILLTVACETDFQNQGAHHLAKSFDKEGLRTIGVLTKPDRIPRGEEESWLRYIRNQEEQLQHGWFSVKQPDSSAILDGITWSEARESEHEFFSATPWSAMSPEYQNRLGTDKLVERLGAVLSDCIAQRLPDIQEEIQKLMNQTDARMAQLPKPISNDTLSEVLHMISTFSKALGKHLEGTPSAGGFLQSIRPACLKFRKAIRDTEPDFRPYEREAGQKTPDKYPFVPPSFLANEGAPFVPTDDNRAIYIDDVMDRARQSITRELPDHYPFVVIQEYITAAIKQWFGPAEALFAEISHILIKQVKELVEKHFVQYPVLQSRVSTIVSEFINDSSESTMHIIKFFVDLEMRPRTFNETLYTDYREKFVAHYKGWRPKENQPHLSFTTRLQEALNFSSENKQSMMKEREARDIRETVTEVLSGLTKLGIQGRKVDDLAKLLPLDPYEPSIEIMASVCAYFQVAYKRFTDNVPNAIDYELVLGLDRDQALEQALREGLGIGGPDTHTKCAELMKEPRHISERREELMKKRERLDTARKQLLEAF